jgi:hypothetical protein
MEHMKILLTTVVLGLVAASSAAGATHARSGLRGTALLSPGSTVCTVGTPCTRPAANTLLRFWRNGRIVAHTRTDSNGRYRLALRPRTYGVTAGDGSYLVTPEQVTVATGHFRRVTFKLDAGIR